MKPEELPTKSHFVPRSGYIEEDPEGNTILGRIKRILNPQPQMRHVYLSTPDFYPAYQSEREARFRAEREVRDLREELHNRRTEYMKKEDKLKDRIYELEEEKEKLEELVKLRMG